MGGSAYFDSETCQIADAREGSEKLLALLCWHHDFSVAAPILEPEPAPEPIPEPPAPTIWFSVVDESELPAPAYPSVASIQAACARHYGVTRHDILSARRTANVVLPRQVGMYLAKVMTPRSFPDIGRRFGGRDHTTAIHSFRKIERLLKSDGGLLQDVTAIKAEIGAVYA